MFKSLKSFLVCASAFIAVSAHAQLSIEVTGAGDSRFPVAIPLFENEGAMAGSITDVVRADLERSGLFSLVSLGMAPLPESTRPDLAGIRAIGADAVLAGSVIPQGGGRADVRFRLFDTVRQTELGAMALRVPTAQHRMTGHRIADYVYEMLTGQPGYFATRIAYVVKSGSSYELRVADSDGMNSQTALVSREPIISPAWAPDGQRIAYVSFEAKKPVVYVHNLPTGQRHVAANFRGSNSAPAWSPDGRQLAVVLTKDGNSQLYVINADGSGARRVMSSSGIDTEPSWAPDGRIYFTSDRGGGPQIYRVSAGGGGAERVTFEGGYNVSPRVSPDGKSMAYVTRGGNGFQVAVMDLASRQSLILTDTSRDESPSFAPNGRMILYATEVGGRGVLSAVSVDGSVRQRLSVQASDVREPAWGPQPRF